VTVFVVVVVEYWATQFFWSVYMVESGERMMSPVKNGEVVSGMYPPFKEETIRKY
jgi:hypothetical protein